MNPMSPVRSFRRPAMTRRFATLAVLGGLLFAACGGDDDTETAATTAAEPGATEAQAADAPAGGDAGYGDSFDDLYASAPERESSAAAGAATIGTGETALGPVLVDADGFTLYGFLPDGDANGEPTCVDDCAGAWPPVLVDGEPDVGDLDPALFTVVEHPDGPMLKAGDWPLYRFAGDSAPGDTNGQGSGDAWFAVSPDGTLID